MDHAGSSKRTIMQAPLKELDFIVFDVYNNTYVCIRCGHGHAAAMCTAHFFRKYQGDLFHG